MYVNENEQEERNSRNALLVRGIKHSRESGFEISQNHSILTTKLSVFDLLFHFDSSLFFFVFDLYYTRRYVYRDKRIRYTFEDNLSYKRQGKQRGRGGITLSFLLLRTISLAILKLKYFPIINYFSIQVPRYFFAEN